MNIIPFRKRGEVAVKKNPESGAIGYIVAWLLGVPASLLLIVFLLRSVV